MTERPKGEVAASSTYPPPPWGCGGGAGAPRGSARTDSLPSGDAAGGAAAADAVVVVAPLLESGGRFRLAARPDRAWCLCCCGGLFPGCRWLLGAAAWGLVLACATTVATLLLFWKGRWEGRLPWRLKPSVAEAKDARRPGGSWRPRRCEGEEDDQSHHCR